MRSIVQKTAFIFLLVAFGHITKGQMKVGDNPTTINAGSILELESTNKGLLFPRITLTNTTTWGLTGDVPVNGMVIYNTKTIAAGLTGTSAYPTISGDGTGLYYWDGMGWVGTKAVTPVGNEPWYVAKTNASDPDVQATSNTQNIYQIGKVGINKNNPAYQLDINGMLNQVVTIPAGGVDTEARTNTMHSGDNVINSAGLPFPASVIIPGIGFTSKTTTGPLAALSLGNQSATGGEKNAASLSLTNFTDKTANVSLEEKASGNHEININTQNGTNYTSAKFEPSKLGVYVNDATSNNNFVIDPLNLSSSRYPATRDDSGIYTPANFLYTDASGKFLSAPMSAIKADLRLVGVKNHITQDAGVGNKGTSLGIRAVNNIAIGEGTLATIGLDDGLSDANIAIGYNSLNLLESGIKFIAIGDNVFGQSSSGNSNIGIGSSVGTKLGSNHFNTLVGVNSLSTALNGENNTTLGYNTLKNHTGSFNNTAIGFEAMVETTLGDFNTAVGEKAMTGLERGSYNTALGASTTFTVNSKKYSTAIGAGATVDADNALVLGGVKGSDAQTSVGLGTAIPTNKLHVVPEDTKDPVKIEGLNAGATTNDIVVSDGGVLKIIPSSSFNQDLRMVGTNNHITQDAGVGSNGTSVGTGTKNIAIGPNTLAKNASGESNIAIGNDALKENTDGLGNIAIGESTLVTNTVGSNNLALGSEALLKNASGEVNSAFGVAALNKNSTGGGNTAIGALTLLNNETGDYNTALGYNADVSVITPLKYATAIGAGAKVGVSNAIVLGGPLNTPASANVGIGTETPAYKLHIVPQPNEDPVRIEGLLDGAGAVTERPVVRLPDGRLKVGVISMLNVITDYSIHPEVGDGTWILDPSQPGATSAITITLPATAGHGIKHYIKAINNAGHDIKIKGFIDGDPNALLSLGTNSAMILQFFGNQWYILSKYN